MKLQTLEEWGAATFFEPPTLATLRRWAASGQITGARKVGRRYYVPEGAGVVEPARLAVESSDPVVNAILNA